MNRSAFVQRVFASALLVGAVLASACDGGDDDGAIPGALTEPYIAFERDFQGFRRWERFDLGRSPAMGDVHLEGHRVDYLNRRPPAGAEEFTFGTIIVKEIEGTRHQIFAMAKRGGGYNASAARGWEWFELEVRPNGSVAIEWRGVEPPAIPARQRFLELCSYTQCPITDIPSTRQSSASDHAPAAQAPSISGLAKPPFRLASRSSTRVRRSSSGKSTAALKISARCIRFQEYPSLLGEEVASSKPGAVSRGAAALQPYCVRRSPVPRSCPGPRPRPGGCACASRPTAPASSSPDRGSQARETGPPSAQWHGSWDKRGSRCPSPQPRRNAGTRSAPRCHRRTP